MIQGSSELTSHYLFLVLSIAQWFAIITALRLVQLGLQPHVGQATPEAYHVEQFFTHNPLRRDTGAQQIEEGVVQKARGIRAPSRHAFHCFCRPHEELRADEVGIKHTQSSPYNTILDSPSYSLLHTF